MSDLGDSISTDAVGDQSEDGPTCDQDNGILNVNDSGNLMLYSSLVNDYHYCPSQLTAFSLWDFYAQVEKCKHTNGSQNNDVIESTT